VGMFTLTMWCRYILSISSIIQKVGRSAIWRDRHHLSVLEIQVSLWLFSAYTEQYRETTLHRP